MCVLQQTVYDSTFSSINLSTFTEEDGTTINFFLLTQVLHILTKKMYSHQVLYLLMCLGTNQQKFAQKPIRYRNIKLEYYFNYFKT